MAVGTGFSYPCYALYTANGNTVTHTGFAVLGRGVSVEIEPTLTDTSNFYADNIVAETAGGNVMGGEATVTIDGLDPATARVILGLPATRTVTVGNDSITVQGYTNAEPPLVSFGYIYEQMQNGTLKYVPTILTKCKFHMPNKSGQTREEDINWQTQELTADFMTDDTTNAEWMYEPTTGFSTEAEARTYLSTLLGV